jgi:hypothetical protein
VHLRKCVSSLSFGNVEIPRKFFETIELYEFLKVFVTALKLMKLGSYFVF